jgi:hypothetical protein
LTWVAALGNEILNATESIRRASLKHRLCERKNLSAVGRTEQ